MKNLDQIFKYIKGKYGYSRAAIVGRSRTRELSFARHIAIYLAKVKLGSSYPQLAMAFHCDQSSARYSFNRIKNILEMTELDIQDITIIKDKRQTFGRALNNGLKEYKRRFFKCWEDDPFGFLMEINEVMSKRLNKGN